MSSRNKVELRIAGKDYTIVGTEPEDYIQRVGHYIDRKMLEILRVNSTLSTSLAAVLTAVNVADDFFKSRENEGQLKRELKKEQEQLEDLKEDKQKLTQEILSLQNKNEELKLELAKREAELKEVRSAMDKSAR